MKRKAKFRSGMEAVAGGFTVTLAWREKSARGWKWRILGHPYFIWFPESRLRRKKEGKRG